MDFRTESAVGLAGQVRRGERSARELVGHALARIEAVNPTINAFVAVDGELALAAAATVDDQVAAGRDPGPLAGLPLGVKDLEDAAGYVTTLGSPAFSGRAPASADSMMVERLVAAGCVVVGKTNTPELGWKADTVNSVFGRTMNPWSLDHSAGGSSGGSAAAIASGMIPLATGSDGGGSLRIPSACCGLSGMKPSLGRVPTGGSHAPDWQNLSTRGPMARKLSDLIAALDVVVGPDATDLRSLPRPEASWLAVLNDPKPPQRVAWSPTLGYAEVDAEVLAICERAVAVLASLGADVMDVETVFDEDPVSEWLILTGAYNLRTHAGFRGTPVWDEIDPVLATVIDGATSISALDMVRAEDATHDLNLRLVDLFHDVRLLVTPTTAAAAPPHALNGSALINGTPDFNWVRFTYPFNMTRSPAATVCAGITSEGIPVGLQLIGPQHGDLVVLRSAAALEEALGFELLPPEIPGLP
ncbi:MAG TPA: amidase [Acidimicrobiales bacterium]|jgi:aspartyl-tRNA(Asn)/glutamyl-tRNA(Gln) amidotransferase subunit A